MSRPTAATAKLSPASTPVAFPRLYETLRGPVRAVLEGFFGLTVDGH